MSESAVGTEAVRQYEAHGAMPASLMDSANGRAWLDTQTMQINEPLLAAVVIDQYGLTRTGRQVTDENGQIVTPSTIKRYLSEEIGAFFPVNTSRLVASAYKTLIDRIPEKSRAGGLKIISAADLQQATLEPPAFVVDTLLPCGLCVLAAPPKTGKSWLCLALADAVAKGEPFWGLETKKGSVLYLALEDTEYRLRERLRKIGSSFPDGLDLASRGARKIDDGLCEQIGEWMKSRSDARLVIVDTLARVKGSAAYGLNGYEADYQQFAPLQEFAQNHKISILVVTHLSKQKAGSFSPDDPFERINGTTGLFGVADAAWIIFGKRGEEMTFRTTGRDAMDAEYKIKLEAESRWRLVGDSETLDRQRHLDEYKNSPIVRTIIELLREGGRWQGSAPDFREEVIRRTGKLPADTMRELGMKLNELEPQLIENDAIMFRKNPGGRRGRDYIFEPINKSI